MEKEKISSGNIIDFNVLKRLMKYLQPYKGRFYFLVFLTVSLGILAPLRPWLIQWTLDDHVAFGDYQSMVYVMGLLIFLLLIQSLVQYFHTYLSGWIGQHVIRDIRIKLYEHLL